MPETVDHPKHYNTGSIEVIDFIHAWDLSFIEGNVIKYICRYKHKGQLEDLKKASWYLDWMIHRTEIESLP